MCVGRSTSRVRPVLPSARARPSVHSVRGAAQALFAGRRASGFRMGRAEHSGIV